MIKDSDLYDMELAAATEDTLMSRRVSNLISEVRSLKHELADPNYLYVGRIHRQGIISRDAEIGRLRDELWAIKGQGTK